MACAANRPSALQSCAVPVPKDYAWAANTPRLQASDRPEESLGKNEETSIMHFFSILCRVPTRMRMKGVC
ncbi:hypothetical protein SKAU_G00364090 [Synaphobranchus kaupii]|uniref:Uncharacterized protein n=1 Tax=Synaphobranchus kaupii TaxID=118154 RepID=A0A9Q1EIV4_SYNKA|nr:hypothetical protein SKAU_G00364090 [Synaphobranchus kaupii]